MSQTLVTLKNLELSLPHKTCFHDFSQNIHFGQRIGIIGRNGRGKSSLLQLIASGDTLVTGEISFAHQCIATYVPQLVQHEGKSGGEAFISLIAECLREHPEILLLDEPTNHLDQANRRYLFRELDNYTGTLIFVSHDEELLSRYAEAIWSFEHEKIVVFDGGFDEYQKHKAGLLARLQQHKSDLKASKSQMHDKLMREQTRAANSRRAGEKSIDNRKWPTVTSHAKARRAEKTSGKKKSDIAEKKEQIEYELSQLHIHEEIKYKFELAAKVGGHTSIISIQDGQIGYDKIVAHGIFLELGRGDRIHLKGKNGSGKTTLLKCITGSKELIKGGKWQLPNLCDIGYLDQYYRNLPEKKTVLELVHDVRPEWDMQQVREHLNSFLFRKNEEVCTQANTLSYGEKARLSLALIAARPPRLLILDEITNNLDLDAKEHVSEVLKYYPGAMIIVSHDPEFVKRIGVDQELGL